MDQGARCISRRRTHHDERHAGVAEDDGLFAGEVRDGDSLQAAGNRRIRTERPG
jgi:hypothetical protein